MTESWGELELTGAGDEWFDGTLVNSEWPLK